MILVPIALNGMARRKTNPARQRPKRRKPVKKAKVRRAKKKKVYNQDRYIIPALRKIWRYYPVRREVLAEASDGRGFWKCYICHGMFEDVQVDHITPIGTCKREDGRTDYNKFIDSLLCQKTNLGVACKSCHSEKTKRENLERKVKKSS